MGNTYRKIYNADLFSRRNNGLHIVSNGNMPVVAEYNISTGWTSHLTGDPLPEAIFYASTIGLKGPTKFRNKYRKYDGNYSSKLFSSKYVVLTDGNKYYTAYRTEDGFVSTDTCDLIDMTTIHSYDIINWPYPHKPIVRECVIGSAPLPIIGPLAISGSLFNGATPAFTLEIDNPIFVADLEAQYPFLTSVAPFDNGTMSFSLTDGIMTYGGTVDIQYDPTLGGYQFESSIGDPQVLTVFSPLTSSDFEMFDNTWTLTITNLTIV